MRCPFCGEENENDARFCVNCGAPFGDRAFECVYAAPAPRYPGMRKTPCGWPAAIPVLMGLASILLCVNAVLYFRLARLYALPRTIIAVPLISVLLSLAALALFIAPTRRTPIVTAIPRMLGVLLSFFNLFTVRPNLLPFLMVLIPAALYIVNEAVRPRSCALAVIHLVVTIAVFAVSILSFDYARIFTDSAPNAEKLIAAGNLASGCASLAAGTGYTVAMLFSRRKYYE